MKKKSKIALVIAAVIGGVVGYKMIKAYKKAGKQIETEKEEIQSGLNQIGLKPEDIEEFKPKENQEEESKSLAALLLAYNSEDHQFRIDDENLLDPYEPEKETIYFRENEFNGKKNIEMICPLQNYVTDYGAPRIGDCMTGFKNAREKMINKFKIIVKPLGILEGYIELGFKLPNDNGEMEDDSRIIQIPREVYEHYRDDQHDGLSAFFEDMQKGENKDVNNEKISTWLAKDITLPEGSTEVKVYRVFLAYKLSWPLMWFDKRTQTTIGITIPQAVQCVKYLIEDLEIGKSEVGNFYDKVMFLTGSENFNDFYNIVEDDTGKRKIIEDVWS